jgi:uncharacterized membrane protein
MEEVFGEGEETRMLISLLAAIHVVAVVIWIGGVAFVTVIVFPMLMRMEDTLEMVLMFHRLENRFAKHAKTYLWITGITGFALLYLEGRYHTLFSTANVGMLAMLVAWLLYLFVLTFEKKIFGKIFGKPESIDAKKVFKGLTAFHWVILGISLFAVAAGVWQGHGG